MSYIPGSLNMRISMNGITKSVPCIILYWIYYTSLKIFLKLLGMFD